MLEMLEILESPNTLVSQKVNLVDSDQRSHFKICGWTASLKVCNLWTPDTAMCMTPSEYSWEQAFYSRPPGGTTSQV